MSDRELSLVLIGSSSKILVSSGYGDIYGQIVDMGTSYLLITKPAATGTGSSPLFQISILHAGNKLADTSLSATLPFHPLRTDEQGTITVQTIRRLRGKPRSILFVNELSC
jgi:hypothetical protein